MKHYLKKGWLGSDYQTFIYANDIIEGSDIKGSKRKKQSVRSKEISNWAILHGFPAIEFFLTSKIFQY